MALDRPGEFDGTPGEMVCRMYGAIDGKVVDVADVPRIAVAALEAYGIPTGLQESGEQIG